MNLAEFDRLALAVLATPQVAAARKELEARYAADPNASWPLARARIPSAVGEYAMAAAHGVAGDPARPVIGWRNACARRHAGLEVPSSRFGTDNADNAYVWISVSPDYTYRIEGQLAPVPACAFTWSLLDNDYVETSQVRTVGLLTNRELVAEPDGRFAITIDSNPADGRPNHIQLTPDAKLLNLRETLSDWETQLPARLRIMRTDGKPTPAVRSLEERAVLAARWIVDGAPHWALKFHHDSYEKLPRNQVQPLMSSAKRLGGLLTQTSSHGWFELAEDEAYVVRVDPFDADYVGFQLADPWMVSADYVDRLGSLNNSQALVDADGRRTYVIARRDPGVHNWLDAGGLDIGGTTIRYQGLKDPQRDLSGAFETWHGKLDSLGDVLPPETVRVDKAGRAAQIARRVASYRRREMQLLGA